MGTVGDAYDNAMAESFFASLECELINRRSWQTKLQARLAVFTWELSLGTTRCVVTAASTTSHPTTLRRP